MLSQTLSTLTLLLNGHMMSVYRQRLTLNEYVLQNNRMHAGVGLTNCSNAPISANPVVLHLPVLWITRGLRTELVVVCTQGRICYSDADVSWGLGVV